MRKSKDDESTIAGPKKPQNIPEIPTEPKPTESQESAKTKKLHKIHFYPQSKIAYTRYVVIFTTFVLLLIGSCTFYYFFILNIFSNHLYDASSKVEEKTYVYDSLTGLEVTDDRVNSAPVYCIQIPNGTDGARPQAGLSEAAVIFEAIAEAGITRFAAIFRNPSASVIGPIRSLRTYYLEWDTPFDCTITHAGGAADANAALHAGNYRDLTESRIYMYRSDKNSILTRRWNNLFTSAGLLGDYASATDHTTSNPKTFPRYDKFAAREAKETFDETVANNTATYTTSIHFRYGNMKNYNPVYTYNAETNTYLRAYESGTPHTAYNCDPSLTGKITPELSCGDPVQLAPSVVIGMIVQEKKAPGGYYEAITTTGTGKAYIFQNGETIEGTWEKPSIAEQIVFRDATGEPITFMPGQIWISAIPAYSSVSYQ